MSADGAAKGSVAQTAAALSLDRRVEIVLLGTGQVGRAFLDRIGQLSDRTGNGFDAGNDTAPRQAWISPNSRLVAVANSRYRFADSRGLSPERVLRGVSDAASPSRQETQTAADDTLPFHSDGSTTRIVVDATASDDIAARHADWLAQGIHVVTANKLGQGAALARWQAIDTAARTGGTIYGDSATVGAGLPLLRTIRELRAGGDAVLGIAGVLSGTLAWLFDRYDGTRPFSACVHEARALGYTEPDPRIDLSGDDVKRKLLILARAGGNALAEDAVQVESLLTPALAAAPSSDLEPAFTELDTFIAHRYRDARDAGRRLCHTARCATDGSARIGIEALPPDHALAWGGGCDNRVVIRSSRYDAQPLHIRGPGAGPAVTAAALLDDVLRIANSRTELASP